MSAPAVPRLNVAAVAAPKLVDQFEQGLDAPICLTWELTYACNLSCVHCLSSSGKRDPRELSTRQCKDIIDELERMQVFYVNIGGGEPTVRSDFGSLSITRPSTMWESSSRPTVCASPKRSRPGWPQATT